MRAVSHIVCCASMLVAVPKARADTFHLMAGLDSYASHVTDTPGLAYSEIGFALTGELSSKNYDIHLDWVNRESLVSSFHRRELHELFYTLHNVGDHLDITVGRFRLPGGFWLIADGGELAYKIDSVKFSVASGLRSFTNARTEADLRANPFELPLAAASLRVKRPTWNAAVTYAYTRDVIEMHRGFTPSAGGFDLNGQTSGSDIVARTSHGEQFLDGQLFWFPDSDFYVAAGINFGTRYLVHFATDASEVAVSPLIAEQPFEAAGAYGLVDWRVTRELRLAATTGFSRTKLLEPPDGDPLLTAFDGSFVDQELTARWRPSRRVRIRLRYRLRLRSASLTNRGAVEGQVAVAHRLNAFGRVSVDTYYATGPLPPYLPGRHALVARAGVSGENSWGTAKVGVLYTQGLGVDGVLSTPSPNTPAGSTLGPYTMEGGRILFARLFADRDGFFAGVDAEVGLGLSQFRTYVQMGWAR